MVVAYQQVPSKQQHALDWRLQCNKLPLQRFEMKRSLKDNSGLVKLMINGVSHFSAPFLVFPQRSCVLK